MKITDNHLCFLGSGTGSVMNGSNVIDTCQNVNDRSNKNVMDNQPIYVDMQENQKATYLNTPFP